MKIKIAGLLFIFSMVSCNSDYTIKPRGYFKIDFPQKKYQKFDDPSYPYAFEYPVYGKVVKDSLFFDEKAENPYWININFPRFNGKIYISYKEIGKNKFDSLVNDAFTMSYKQHTYKASAIEPTPFTTPNNLNGKKMAAYWFFPIQFSIIISGFNTTFNDALLVPKAISTYSTINRRSYPSEFPVIKKFAVFIYFFQAFRSQIRLYRIKILFEGLHFLFFQGSTCISIFAAAAFAFVQVANKPAFNYIITYQYIINRYQWNKFLQK